MGAPIEVGAVRRADIGQSVLDMSLDHHDPWLDACDRLPDPVVVAVDVDRQNVDRPLETGTPDDVVHVLARDEGLHRLRRICLRIPVGAVEPRGGLDRILICVDEQPVEAEIQREVGAVACGEAIAGADIDEAAAIDAHDREQKRRMPSSSTSEKTRNPTSRSGGNCFSSRTAER